MLFEDSDRTNTEQYYNQKIEKVEMIIEGVFNQLYRSIKKLFHYAIFQKFFFTFLLYIMVHV